MQPFDFGGKPSTRIGSWLCARNFLFCVARSLTSKTRGRAKDFFRIIQRIYTTFANSTKKLHILKENISSWTLKSVSATRWESRVESVKSIRLQCVDIREALLQVQNNFMLNDIVCLVFSYIQL